MGCPRRWPLRSPTDVVCGTRQSSKTLVSQLCVSAFRRVCLCQQVAREEDRGGKVRAAVLPAFGGPTSVALVPIECVSFAALRLRLSTDLPVQRYSKKSLQP